MGPDPAGSTGKNTVIRTGCSGLLADLPGRPQRADRLRHNGFTISPNPFGIQHLKLALLALAPIGMEVIPREQLAERLLQRQG